MITVSVLREFILITADNTMNTLKNRAQIALAVITRGRHGDLFAGADNQGLTW